MSVVKIYTPSEARTTILRRVQWEDQEMPASVLDGIERIFGARIAPAEAVARILRDVRARGDAALHEWAQRIDRRPPGPLEVPAAAWRAAYERLPEEQRAALDLAAERIAAFHRKQPMSSWVDTGPDGTLGQLIRPLDRAGVYVPGGTAPLPSSLLMAAIPARVAGVGEVVVCTPAGSAGVNDLILAAAHVAKVDRLFALGGAQAIAALAYGTETVPRGRQDRRRGRAVRHAGQAPGVRRRGHRRLLRPHRDAGHRRRHRRPGLGRGRSAGAGRARRAGVAHPADAIARRWPKPWPRNWASQLEGLSRAEIAAASLADRGGIVVTADLAEAVELANLYAPEHLCLLVAEPWALVGQIRNAGGIFVGEHSFEVLGDYVAGPSHVMPTEGSARYASPLSVADFVKRISLIAFTREAGARLSAPAAVLARGEGLTAHAAAAEMRTR